VGLDLGDYEVAIRFTKDFYNENKQFIEGLVDIVQKPVLIEMWDDRFFYFVLKFEFNFVDTLDKASALSTVQIDVENAERYDIAYVDEAGEKAEANFIALLSIWSNRARHVCAPGESRPRSRAGQAAHAANLALAHAGQDHTSG